MLPRGLLLGLRAAIVLMSLSAAGCHATPGQLPVDSPVYTYKAPDMDDDDDTDTNDSSEGSAAEGSGSAAKEK